MTIAMYGIRNCDTVRKACAWLEAHQVDYRFHDYKSAGIDEKSLRRWCAELGWEALLNRNGTTFRKLPERERQDLDECKAVALMLAQPSLIKRPLLDLGRRRLLGFRPELYAGALGGKR